MRPMFCRVSVRRGNKAPIADAITGPVRDPRPSTPRVSVSIIGKQNKKLTGLVVIGSDFQKAFAHLPF